MLSPGIQKSYSHHSSSGCFNSFMLFSTFLTLLYMILSLLVLCDPVGWQGTDEHRNYHTTNKKVNQQKPWVLHDDSKQAGTSSGGKAVAGVHLEAFHSTSFFTLDFHQVISLYELMSKAIKGKLTMIVTWFLLPWNVTITNVSS